MTFCKVVPRLLCIAATFMLVVAGGMNVHADGGHKEHSHAEPLHSSEKHSHADSSLDYHLVDQSAVHCGADIAAADIPEETLFCFPTIKIASFETTQVLANIASPEPPPPRVNSSLT